jgi:NAD(P)-dependent dehydrogenase (short-subunit alcohol dehydrogenase family)
MPRSRGAVHGDLAPGPGNKSARSVLARKSLCRIPVRAWGWSDREYRLSGGLYPASSSIAYSASKAGLIHLTRCLAVALAPDVTVNCIAPGLIESTHMAQRIPKEVVQQTRQQVVLGRVASLQDITEQVITFCRAESITGQVLVIDGGMPGCMY